MPFPILRTPFVVLSEIISFLEPNEIVSASFCSKDVGRLLKRHYEQRKPLEWRLSMIDYDAMGRVSIKTSKDCKPIIVILAKHISQFKGHTLEDHTNGYEREFASSKRPVLYFNDQVLGTKWIVDYVTGLLTREVFSKRL
ncbi:hypothetical protein B9Z55_015884 [Caenorhabditis nigoni]|uniref:F-box domain-containing protein n=1 Tax=Caenorhabditis nigoni TaxID=1611254 RepID=A0A2G5UCA1_9PELO|nr:hypothetical protein B9Z55_015884 [Caenorhabditis nigoni]